MAGNKRLLGVQYLRAVAALMIAYFHLVGVAPTLAFRGALNSSRLPSGVWIFFVISGFIMCVTARKLSPREFVWRRIVRIVPLYWALTLTICAIGIVAPSALHRTQVTVGAVVQSLLFIPYHNAAQRGVLFPLLVPGWTLDYEMAFYGLFAIALLARRYCAYVAVGALCALAVVGMIHSRPEMTTLFGFYFNSRLLLFASGILLAAAYEHMRVPRIICVALIVAGFWLLLASWQGEGASQAADLFGATGILLGAVAWERQFGLPEWRALVLLGDASYSIYLTHTFAFRAVAELWRQPRLQEAAGAIVFGIVSMAAAIGLALMTYHLIEKPTLELLSGRKRVTQPKILHRPA